MLQVNLISVNFESFQEKAIGLILDSTDSPNEVSRENILKLNLSMLYIDSLRFMEIIIELEDLLDVRVNESDMAGDPLLIDFLKAIHMKTL